MVINQKKIRNSMAITRGDIERHRMKFTYNMLSNTCHYRIFLDITLV